MTIQLPDDLDRFVCSEVESGRYASADDVIVHAVRRLLDLRGLSATPAPSDHDPDERPIWEKIQEITASIPAEEWAKLPVDGAEQHDHYIYGTPKRPPSQ